MSQAWGGGRFQWVLQQCLGPVAHDLLHPGGHLEGSWQLVVHADAWWTAVLTGYGLGILLGQELIPSRCRQAQCDVDRSLDLRPSLDRLHTEI